MHKSKRYQLASLIAACFASRAMGSMNIYLDFGSSFESEVNSVNAICGQANYTDTQISAMESAVQQQLTTLYSDYQITFSLTNSTGARVVNFSSDIGGTLYGETTEAPFGNYDTSANDYCTIFPQNFIRPLQVTSIDADPSLYLADYTRFLTNVTGHELGHSFGLQHWDSYGVPQITPANYANTTNSTLRQGYQALDLISDLNSGKGDADELSSQTTIGLWDRAKFDVTGGTADGGASIVNHPVLEVTGTVGHSLAAATPLAFTTGETSGLQLSLRRTTLDSSGNDFYKFSTTSGGQFTSEVISSTGIAGRTGLSFHPKITLFASDGVTPIWSNDGLSYSGNLYDTPPTPNTSYVPVSDPFLDNISIPSAGTYFINVQAEGSFASGDLYQMLSGFNAGYVQPDTFVYQNASSGNWNNTAAWKSANSGSSADFPANDSTAIAILGSGWVTSASISNASIQFNQTYTSGLDELQIDSGNTLVQSSSNSAMVVNKIALGMAGPGGYNQSAGTNSVAQFITLGNSPGNIGTYALSGSAQLINSGNEYVGYNGTGTFTQTGGTNHLFGDLLIAANTGSSGTYNLGDGTLTIDLGADGIILNTNGTFHQTGGTLTFPGFTQNGGTALFDNGLDLSAATYSLNGGSLTIPSNQNLTIENVAGTNFTLNSPTATLTVGALNTQGNPANFIWNAGTLETSSPLDFVSFPDPFGYAPLGNTPLVLNSNKHLIVNELEWLPDTGDSITQTTGSTNTCISLYTGSPDASATYNLNGGTFTSTLLEYLGVQIQVGTTTYGGPGSFQQTGGMNIANTLGVGFNSAGTYTMSGGTLTAVSTFNAGTITQTGGNATLGPLSGSGYLSVGGGTGTASMTVTQFTQGTLTIADQGLFSVQPNSHFDNSASALSMSGSGQLDLANNHLFINYGGSADPKISIAAWIKNGFASGTWTGPGIISTYAQTNSAHFALGYADSADPGNPVGLDSSGQIEIKYTLLGDANLDGTVDSSDFALLAANYGKTGESWINGDYNYDGTVNALDFNALATNYGQILPNSADVPDSATPDAAMPLGAIVPEPTSLAALITLGLLRRRRMRSKIV